MNNDSISFEDTYINDLKRAVALRGVVVHVDMQGPVGQYEIFTDGVASYIPATARSYSTRCDQETVACWIADSFKHVAFYEHLNHRVRDAISNEEFSYHTIRFAGWN